MKFKLFAILLLVIMSGCKDKENGAGGAADVNGVRTGRSSKPWTVMGAGSDTGGGISNNPGESMSPDVAVWRMDNPVVCWSNSIGDAADRRFEIYVKRWNGSAWVEMGTNSASGPGISSTDGNSTYPEIVINRAGVPIICWLEEQKPGANPVSHIFVKQYNGSAWVEMGMDSATCDGISENENYCSMPSMAINSEGSPIICWAESAGSDTNIRVKQWDGRGWSEIESISIMPQNAMMKENPVGVDKATSTVRPEIQVAKDGKPVVCWANCSSENCEIYVKQWDVNEWKEMGKDSASNSGISGNSGSSVNPAITVDWDGMPVICWQDDTNGNSEIYVRQWNGFDWIEISKGSASGGGISGDETNSVIPNICIDQEGAPVVCWISEGDIKISQWNGSSWGKIGEANRSAAAGTAPDVSAAGRPAIAIDSGDNAIVAFDGLVSGKNRRIYVRKYPLP